MHHFSLSILGGLFLMTSIFAAEIPIKVEPTKAIQLLRKKNKTIVTFVGYSGKGYKNLSSAMKTASELLEDDDPRSTIVNIGATPEGIGQVYCIAKEMGFETSGIVSSQGEQYLTKQSTECVDTVLIIQDNTWGGKDAIGYLNPTSEAMVKVSDIVIRLGGGQIALDEASAAFLKKVKK